MTLTAMDNELVEILILTAREEQLIRLTLLLTKYRDTAVFTAGSADVIIRQLQQQGLSVVSSVRIDPAKTRTPPLGYADEVPHAHKEVIPTAKVSGGNYKPKDAVTLDENGNPSKSPTNIHLPIK